MNTIEKNKLIAEFMGMTVNEKGICDPYPKVPKEYFMAHDFDVWCVSTHLYQTSWDWLMPVVEKIEAIELKKDLGDGISVSYKYRVEIRSTYCCIEADNTLTSYVGFRTFDDEKLNSTYKSVLKFIKWYNSQN